MLKIQNNTNKLTLLCVNHGIECSKFLSLNRHMHDSSATLLRYNILTLDLASLQELQRKYEVNSNNKNNYCYKVLNRNVLRNIVEKRNHT